MTLNELVKSMWDEMPHLQLTNLTMAVDNILALMRQALADGSRIEIRGLGSFSLKTYAPRQARNPKTGKSVMTDTSYQVHFKPSASLLEKINKKTFKPRSENCKRDDYDKYKSSGDDSCK